MKPLRNLMLLSALATCALAGAGWAKGVGGVRVADHKLGFSGATVSVREDHRHTKWPAAERAFTLVGANGERRQLPLRTGSASLNLWEIADDRYVLTGEGDCIQFDPIRVRARYCAKPPPCVNGAVTDARFIGRFDWMNGYDPPKGEFHFDFRFGPFQDAAPGGCPAPPPSAGGAEAKS